MAALAPLATLASTGFGVYAQQQQQAQARAQQRAQVEIQHHAGQWCHDQRQLQPQAEPRLSGETLAPHMLVGGGLILGAALLAVIGPSRFGAPRAPEAGTAQAGAQRSPPAGG